MAEGSISNEGVSLTNEDTHLQQAKGLGCKIRLYKDSVVVKLNNLI